MNANFIEQRPSPVTIIDWFNNNATFMLRIERFSYLPFGRCPVGVRYLFYQPVVEKIKTWPLRFPAKEDPAVEKALFDWPIV